MKSEAINIYNDKVSYDLTESTVIVYQIFLERSKLKLLSNSTISNWQRDAFEEHYSIISFSFYGIV